MAIIKKTITGLRPGSDYLFTVKPKNSEILASDEIPESIRVSIPQYDGIPSSITNLQLASNFQTVIFKFDAVSNIDLDYYEYQVYDNALGSGDPINAKTSTSRDKILVSGFNKANVFSVSVTNSSQSIDPVTNATTTNTLTYWGRVRAVNTFGNPSTSWSDLISSSSLSLIADQFIGNLTAAKITAGTIGAHTITLAGANSIIKSSIYNSTQGWQIDGVGNATFNTATIRGQFSSGTSPNWFRVDSAGQIWSGASTYTAAADTFRVSSSGNLTALSGRVGPFTISAAGISNIGVVGDYSYTNYMRIQNYGDITIFSNPNSGYYPGMYHTTTLFGEWVQVTKHANSSFGGSLIEARMGNTYGTDMEFAMVVNGTDLKWRATSLGESYQVGSATALSYLFTSDIRMKENIIECESILNAFNNLSIKRFNFKQNQSNDPAQYGLIAQDVLEIFPDIVKSSSAPNADMSKAGENMENATLTLDSTSLLSITIKAIQELSKKVEQLESRLV